MSKRELITPNEGDSRYVRRDDQGRFKESVDVGRSQKRTALRIAENQGEVRQGDRRDQKK